MGVHGLWPILEPAGHPVTMESLEGKRLAIDVSIWLHQASKGAGAHQLNARNPHLSLLLNRLAKLLFYRIRPVFVFDGTNVPQFKKRILAERRVKRDLDTLQLTKAQKKVLEAAALTSAAGKASTDDDNSRDQTIPIPYATDDLFQLPSTSQSAASTAFSTSDSEDEDVVANISSDYDVEVLDRVPAELRMEMLLDAQERAKDARLRPENLPSNAVRFSRFQLDRLLKRKKATEHLDRVKKQIVGTVFDERAGDVKMAVFEGRKRGHVVQIDRENGSDAPHDTPWPVIAAHMSDQMKPKVEDLDLQLAIEASLQPDFIPDSSNDAAAEDVVEEITEEVEASLSHHPSAAFDNVPSASSHSPLPGDAHVSNSVINRPDLKDLTADGWSSSDDGDLVDVSDVDDDLVLLSDNVAQATSNHSPPSKENDKPTLAEENEVVAIVNGDADHDHDPDPDNDDYYRKELPENGSTGESLAEAIYVDCQELLRLCGIPFVVAPGEAEAQCAHLEQLKLVNGTVSDDSDVWLFGASTVYRHMFDRRKHVQCFSQSAVRQSLGLTRNEMIQVAMLSGADYTTGFEGVGVVTALELIAEFASDLKKNELDDGFAVLRAIDDWRSHPPPPTESPIRRRLRKALSNGRPPINFPDPLVYDAYVQPNVDESTESFQWGRPDVNGLKRFVWDKLGWPEEKVDSVMKPAFVKWNEYLNGAPLQTRITSFTVKLHKDPEDMKLYSTRRVETALKRLQKVEASTESSSKTSSKGSQPNAASTRSKPQKKGAKKRPNRRAAAKAAAKVFQISESSSSESE